MNWQQRWREMLLAGGAVTATACSGSNAVSSSDASASDAGSATFGGASDAGGSDESSGGNFCCNASGDPCCYLACTPDAAPAGECLQEMDCLSDGGGWDYFASSCVSRDDAAPLDAAPGPAEAGPADAAPSDAPDDAAFGFPCCNANADPCCPIAYCAGGVGPDAAVYVDCEQSRSACAMTNGSYEPQPDGALGCTR